VPGALLLPAPGDTAGLRVVGITASGDTTEVDDAVSWTSSTPGIVVVSAAGVATAQTLGTAVVTAQAGGLTSSPILALVAQPATGALLVSDDQVIGAITPVDPAASYVPGWQYRVRLRGVSPEVNQVVLASGGAPVGGRVVSVSPAADGDVDVVLALLSLGGMFADLSVDVQVPLANAPVIVPRASIGRAAKPAPRAPGVAERQIEQEFSIGRFDCKAEIPPAFQFPLTVDNFDVEVFPQLTLDLRIVRSGLRRLVVHGSVAAQISANPLITAALEAKAECLFTARVIILPIGGPISLIIGGQVPVGVGIEAGTKATFGQLGFDAFYEASLTAEFGIDCTAECDVVADMTASPPEGFFKPRLPTFEDDLRFEVTGSAFGFAKLTVGNPFLRQLRFEVVELKAGLTQKFELAGRSAQANDAAYASTFALRPFLEFKTSSKLQAVANLLEVTLADLSFAPELPVISQSPRGSFTITPGTVVAGDGSSLGQMATFTVTLDPVTYLGAYAVESVELFRRVTSGGTTTLEPGRPGCTRVQAAQDQTVFTCQATFLEEHAGSQEFFAFVNARIFGVPMPTLLEVASDGKAVVVVTTGGPPPPPPPPPGSCHPAIRFPGFNPDSVGLVTCVDALLVDGGGTVAFTQLREVKDGLATRNTIGLVTFPVLSKVGGGASFSHNGQQEFALPSLTQVEGGIVISNMGQLQKLTIGAAVVTDGLEIGGNPLLSDISQVSCGLNITGGLIISDNPSLPTATAQAKANCITADEKTVEGNGP
jgi:hypothetical protein